MAEQLHYAVRSLLRSSEEVRVILETAVTLEPTSGVDGSSERDSFNRRILVVVTHRDEVDGREQGSVLVLKFKPTFALRALDVHRVYPINGAFAITMAQTRQSAPDVSSSTSTIPQVRSELLLTIHPGQGSQVPLTLLTHDVHTLSTLLGECKRLKDLADPSPTTYVWLKPYTSVRTARSIFSETPPDLRTTSLNLRLSRTSAGSPGDDVGDIETIRDKWIGEKARKETGCGFESLIVRLGTFNVSGKLPSQDLSGWVRGRREVDVLIPPLKQMSPPELEVETGDSDGSTISNDAHSVSDSSTLASSPNSTKTLLPLSPVDLDPQIIVLGFQELDLSTEALLYSTGTLREDTWFHAVMAGLGEKGILYEKLASKQLVGMLLLILVKKTLKSCFGDIKVAAAGAGMMGMMGNKGGTAIRLLYTPPPTQATPAPASTTLTFVNSHLAAFDEMVDKRNADFHDLSRRLGFRPTGAGDPLDQGDVVELESIFESDVLFWMVNLNYRLNLPDEDVRGVLVSENWPNKFEELLKFDQLNNAKRFNKAFVNFMEAPISHLPTYRFSPGVPTDLLGYDMKRKPAWTDRILYYPDPLNRLTPLRYGSHPEILMSDHKPLSAEYKIQVDAFDRKRYAAAVRGAFAEVANMGEVEDRPQIKIHADSINFGTISYKRRVARTVDLQNPGKVACAFRFVPTELGTPISPAWLRVDPIAGVLLPNEIATLTFTAFVDDKSAARLNLGPRHIDCTLILHTLLGKDHFISITADFEYTCFANSLSRLIRLPGPISRLQGPADLLPQGRSINAPREIMRLINWLMSDAINVGGLFITPGDDKLVHTIRECLDTGDDFPFSQYSNDPNIVLAFGDALLQLLRSLVESLVPASLHSKFEQVSSRDEAFELLDTFPPESINVWISVTAFLLFVGQQPSKEANPDARHKSKNLAAIFAPVLLRDDPNSVRLPISPVAKRNFLLCFIT